MGDILLGAQQLSVNWNISSRNIPYFVGESSLSPNMDHQDQKGLTETQRKPYYHPKVMYWEQYGDLPAGFQCQRDQVS